MFREMRRVKQQVSEETCLEILKTENRCVLSVIGEDGYPYGIPMDFYYCEEDGKLYFHCAKMGHKIDALRADNRVCFTTWNTGFQKDGDWAWNVTSIVAFGRIELVEDRNLTEKILLPFGMKFYPTQEEVEEEIHHAVDRVQLLCMTIDHMTGKLVNEK